MQIGRFHQVGTGYAGRLQTLALDVPLRLVPTQRQSDKAPDWRVHQGDNGDGPEIGSGWTHEREGGAPSSSIAPPSAALCAPISCQRAASRTVMFSCGRGSRAARGEIEPCAAHPVAARSPLPCRC